MQQLVVAELKATLFIIHFIVVIIKVVVLVATVMDMILLVPTLDLIIEAFIPNVMVLIREIQQHVAHVVVLLLIPNFGEQLPLLIFRSVQELQQQLPPPLLPPPLLPPPPLPPLPQQHR